MEYFDKKYKTNSKIKDKLLKKIKIFFNRDKDKNNLENNIENFLSQRLKNKKPLKFDEEKIISNVFALPEKLVSDIMIPRSDILSIDATSSIKDLVKLIGVTNHSRYPVYEKSRDNIIGMVHIKDVISVWKSKKEIKIKKLIRKILFAPPSMTVLDLILEMRKTHIHMSMIIDEHGGVDGLVTIEDLVEEIVGEIKDEHESQQDKQERGYVKTSDGNIIVNARMLIEEFEEKYGKFTNVEDNFKDIDTIGGFVFHLFGRVPLKGEIIKHPSGCEFQIVETDSRRIRKILIKNHRRL